MIENDTLFIKDFDDTVINYIKKYDALGTPSKQLIARNDIIKLCEKFNLNIPNQINELPIEGNYKWDINIYSKHINNNLQEDIYPYFNNGFILIKKIFHKKFNDQWIVGLILNNTTNNWGILPKKLNYCLNESQKKLKVCIQVN